MKELVEVIAKALVDHPEEVSVNEKKEGRTTVLELHVAEGDMGKVIGKQGRIAKAIRSVVKAAAAKEGFMHRSGSSPATWSMSCCTTPVPSARTAARWANG